MLTKLKYYLLAALALPPIQNFLQKLPKKHQQLYLKIFIISVIAASLYGAIGVFLNNQHSWLLFKGKGPRSGGLTDIMRFSYGLALISPFFFTQLFQKPTRLLPKPWFIAAVVFSLFGLLTSQSRGAIAIFFLAGALTFFVANKKARLKIVVLSIIAASAYLILITNTDKRFLGSRLFQKLSSHSNMIRLSMYQSALYAMKEKPILGYGMSHFQPQVKRIKKQYHLPYQKKFSHTHSHNVFLELGAQLGLSGLTCFLLFFFFWGKEAFHYRRGYIFIPFIICYFLAGMVEQLMLNNMFTTFAWYHLLLAFPLLDQSRTLIKPSLAHDSNHSSISSHS